MSRTIVIGHGPCALRAAGALSLTGQPVTLLLLSPHPLGLADPTLPAGRAAWEAATADRKEAEGILGALRPADDLRVGIQSDSDLRSLPLSVTQVHQLFPSGSRRAAAQSWLRARGRNGLAELIGGGQEERSYRDWVVRRMGAPAWEELYSPYVRRRWAPEADDLSASLARRVHGPTTETPRWVPADGRSASLEHARAAIRASGGEIKLGVQVHRLGLSDGQVDSVDTHDGKVSVDGPLYTTVAPGHLATWLGDALPGTVRHDATHLEAAPMAVVGMRAQRPGAPDEVHILASQARFWRTVAVPGSDGRRAFHVTLPAGQVPPDAGELIQEVATSARDLGWEVDPEEATVDILEDWVPRWTATGHARMRVVSRAFREVGVHGVGRAGAFADLDPPAEVAYARHVARDPLAVWRRLAAPPVRAADLGARITRFLCR